MLARVKDLLEEADLHPQVGVMSTVVDGDADVVFFSLHKAFVEVSMMGHVVMTVTFSNACPVTGSAE